MPLILNMFSYMQNGIVTDLEGKGMGQNASGMYIVDDNYNIVGFNTVAEHMYPRIKKEEKCYRCLMNQEVPCAMCPIYNKIEGPKTYIDPVSGHYETVDAVDMDLPDGTHGHALIFGFAAEDGQKAVNEPLPANKEGLGLTSIINVLGSDYRSIYSVDRKTQQVSMYLESKNADEMTRMKDTIYTSAIKSYVKENVLPQDQYKLEFAMNFESLCAHLKRVPQFMVHYRSEKKETGEIHYNYIKCARVGSADSFETIVLAFANEDADIKRSQLQEIVSPGSNLSKRRILIVEDDELNREILKDLLCDQYDVLCAEDGAVGLKLLEEHYAELSVVLLDMFMPVCDGFQFLKEAKKNPILALVPIIVMTGSGRQEDEARCLELGASDFVPKPYNQRVVKARINSVIKLKESAAALSAIEYDDLTGLYTKSAFYYHAGILMRYKPDQSYAVIMADVKNFKLINNIYGIRVGDDILRYLAKIMSKALTDGLAARYSDDQFVMFTSISKNDFEKRLENAVKYISENAPIANLLVKYGVYKDVDKSISISEICDRAIMAMKSIQLNYEKNIAYYDDQLGQQHIREVMMENDFENALRNEEFEVWFQPKYNVQTEKIAGAEALIRWRKQDGSMVSPGAFIPLFERDGLITRLDEYVFKKVCQIQKERLTQGKPFFPISINLSRASLHHEGLVENYTRIVKENNIPFDCVPIELTESAAMYSIQIKALVDMLVASGFKLHMDDFGTGFSSLTSLNVLPFDVIKLDKSLIDYIGNESGDQIIQHVIALAHGLNMKVVAEGVEKKEQVAFLQNMNCDQIQGYYYSSPKSYEVFDKMI